MSEARDLVEGRSAKLFIQIQDDNIRESCIKSIEELLAANVKAAEAAAYEKAAAHKPIRIGPDPETTDLACSCGAEWKGDGDLDEQEWWTNHIRALISPDKASALSELLAAERAKARLEEAKWWRHLAIMHDESYFAVEGDKRIAELRSESESPNRVSGGGE